MTQAATKPAEDRSKRLIGYAWNYTTDLGNGNSFQVTGNFTDGASEQEMNAEVDKVRNVANRQQAKSVVPALEQQIEKLKAQAKMMEDDIARVDEKYAKQGGPKVSEREQRELAAGNLKKTREDIVAKQAYLDKIRKEAE